MRLIYALLLILWTVPVYAAEPTTAQIIHLLNRISFGPGPGDVNNVRQMGVDAYITLQLHPQEIAQSDRLTSELANLHTLSTNLPDLVQEFTPADNSMATEEQKKALRQSARIIVDELTEAKIRRAVESPAQLQEVMTDFWYNHFNVFSEKNEDRLLVGGYERDAIRPYALGKFGDLLMATAQHPAMLIYLDNAQNVAPAIQRNGKQRGINENYAREIMELHTMGVDSGYTQADVTALAHILTGWGLGQGKSKAEKAHFYFNPKLHDWSQKTFLGHVIEPTGENEVHQALDMIIHHPSTGYRISFLLAQYFVADAPPQTLVNHLAEVYAANDGDIAIMLNYLFHSPEFWNPAYTSAKFKPPFRYIISMLRASGSTVDDIQFLKGSLRQMGEMPYQCLTPNGYSNTKENWFNSDALLKRMNIARTFLRKSDDAGHPVTIQQLAQTFDNHFTPNTVDVINQANPKLQPVLLLTSPEFLYY